MPVYRAEQAHLSIASEAGAGGYMEIIDTTTDAADWTALLSAALPAGSRAVTFDTGSGTLAVGNYILIGTAGDVGAEIRRIASLGSYNGTDATGTILLDYPTGFPHANNDPLDERSNAAPTGSTYTAGTTGGAILDAGDGGINFATFLPGVYETITTPDLTPEMLPQYFLKTTGDRNWAYMYRGKQSFTGSVSNFILLNGYPLKYPFGRVASVGTDSGAGGSDTDGATLVGDRAFTITSATGYAAGDFIQIGTGNTAEVRQIIIVSGTTITLNYPLMIAHADAETCNEVIAPFTHTMVETAELASMTWNVLMRDSEETAANDFIRRFVGGKVNRATLSADEGELLRYAWDDVQFLDLVHNQTRHSAVTGDASGADIMAKSSNMLLTPIGDATNAGIGGDMPNASGALSAAVYPTTEPYYFSQGALVFFGVTFARIRNFRLEINNNTEPKYYINDQARDRIPTDIQEQRREYTLTATIAMPDTVAANATTRTLWKELILEGALTNPTTGAQALTGFDITLTFTRGASDTITLTSPSSAASTAFEGQGCFFRRAQNSIEQESPVQVEGEIILRNLSTVIVDQIAVYP